MDSLLTALRQHYGWSAFRPGQRPLIEAVLAGQDSLAVLPTGGGKSLCYQLPALIQEGLVIVISPLIALMEDQIIQLKRRGIAALSIHAGLDEKSRNEAISKIKDKNLRLLYLSPERLLNNVMRNFFIDRFLPKD